jgi:type I restriction enzyme R subunit
LRKNHFLQSLPLVRSRFGPKPCGIQQHILAELHSRFNIQFIKPSILLLYLHQRNVFIQLVELFLVSLLKKLLLGEIKTRSRRNVVQARLFSELLEKAIRKYQNRAVETAQVIEELIGLAKHMREEEKRGAELHLNEDEVAFYDALETNDSAVKVLGDETLRMIARELVETVRKNTTIDWTIRENVRANLRVIVKRILRKYGYPPDKQEKATITVLEQAELLSANWSIA